MVIDIGAKVLTRDGKNVGSVERVVLDPGTAEVTHLVLHKGLILTRDTVVPISAVRRVRNHSVHLGITSADLKGMPVYEETEYVVPQQAPIGPYVPGDVLWPTAYAYAPTVVREERHLPPSSIDFSEGTDVECTDGKIGVVDKVVVSDAGEIIGLVLKDGEARSGVIPASWVAYADSKVVRVDRTKDEIKDYFRSEDIRG